MTKIGRNDPCRCGSGKKYKRCCMLVEDAEAAERARAAAEREASRVLENASFNARRRAYATLATELDELDQLSNRAIDLIHTGHFDEAEALCDRLQRDYPDAIDGLDRRARLYEARGDHPRAIELYRQMLVFTREHNGFEDEFRDWIRQRLERLVSMIPATP